MSTEDKAIENYKRSIKRLAALNPEMAAGFPAPPQILPQVPLSPNLADHAADAKEDLSQTLPQVELTPKAPEILPTTVEAPPPKGNRQRVTKTRKRRRNAGEGLIRRRHDGRWEARISLGWQNGQRVQRSFYGGTAEEVNALLLKARTDQQAGLPVKAERQSVGQFLERWLRDAVAPSVRALTLEQYEQHARLYLFPAFGTKPLQKLFPPDVQRFIAERLAIGLSPRTVRISLFVLSRALAQAVKWNLIARNPVDAVDLPKADRPPVKTFSEREARALLAAVKGDPAEPAYLLALLCGLRRGELLALKWEDLDFDAGTLAVHRALERIGTRLEFVEPKSRSGRRILPMPEPVLKVLKAHRARQSATRLSLGPAYEDHGLLFPNSLGRPLEPRAFNRQFKAALARAGLPSTLRLHDCRHFAATAMITDGADVRTVAGLLGHADPSLTVRTYAHIVPEAARRAVERMGALIDAESGDAKRAG